MNAKWILLIAMFSIACQSRTEVFSHRESLINNHLIHNNLIHKSGWSNAITFSFNQQRQNLKKFKMIRTVNHMMPGSSDTSFYYFNSEGLLRKELLSSRRKDDGNQYFLEANKYTYDTNARLISKISQVRDENDNGEYLDSTFYFYRDDGLLQKIRYPNSTSDTYQYLVNDNEQVIAIFEQNSDKSDIHSYQIKYDLSDADYALVTGNFETQWEYRYNNLGVLIYHFAGVEGRENGFGWKCNDKGDLIMKYQPQGWGMGKEGLMSEYEFDHKYNEDGDWILQTMYIKEGPITTERAVIYWK